MTRVRKLVVAGAAAAALVAAGASLAGYLAWRHLTSPMALAEARTLLDVPDGTPLSTVSAHLAERGILKFAPVLTWYGRYTGAATRIHAGEYELRPGMTPVDLLDTLVAGRVFLHQFTIVEGWRFEELLRLLRAHPAVATGTQQPSEIMAELGKPDLHPEGQFFPDTYTFPRGTPDVQVLGWAHTALQRRLEAAWDARARDIQLQSAYEALILASIIEKETALASERRLISGVFHERLKRGMRLQTDPTVIYGLGETFDGDLRRADLTTDTPYNTYTRNGLPPTPIALPSGASIDAAVDPEPSDALYFVATGLADGSHYFSSTLEEHNRAVGRYLERSRAPR